MAAAAVTLLGVCGVVTAADFSACASNAANQVTKTVGTTVRNGIGVVITAAELGGKTGGAGRRICLIFTVNGGPGKMQFDAIEDALVVRVIAVIVKAQTIVLVIRAPIGCIHVPAPGYSYPAVRIYAAVLDSVRSHTVLQLEGRPGAIAIALSGIGCPFPFALMRAFFAFYFRFRFWFATKGDTAIGVITRTQL